MICICGQPCHETPSGDQWKVQVNGLGSDVLLQIQDRDGEQVRIALSPGEADLLGYEVQVASGKIQRAQRDAEKGRLLQLCAYCGVKVLCSSTGKLVVCGDCAKVPHEQAEPEPKPIKPCLAAGEFTCHVCPSLACDSNTGPGRELFGAAKRVLELSAGVTTATFPELTTAVKKLEEMG